NCLVINPSITQAKFVIPVVIHIVHLPSDSIIGMGSNISTDQINDQLKRLNEYFSNENGGSISVNTGIQFCLAPVGPNNDGVIRYSNIKSNHEIDTNKYLEFLALNTTLAHDRFLHIFTCNNILADTSIRGYSSALDDKYQGVVIEYNMFGKFNPNNTNINVISGSEGKMLVHEVGHFLGLEHTFFGGCGQDTADCHNQGDRCCDTPPVASFNSNCSSGRNSCYELYQKDLPDQTENYMDYAEDACKNTFTHDQTQIMHYVLLNKRTNLIDPKHINSLNLPCATFSAFFRPGSNTACQNDTISFTALRYSDTVNAIYTWEVIRNNVPVFTLSDTNLYSIKVGLDSVGIYKMKLTVTKSGSTVSETLNDAVLSQNCGTPKANTQGNWYFGKNAGIQFTNSNQVVSSSKAFYADPNPTIDSDEGCITQSAKNGRLLFYGGGKTEFGTNGIAIYDTFYVYDKTHKLMPNGALKGSSSSTQGGVVIPHPENGARFYLLTTNQVSSNSNFDEY
ncbi:MAG: hypothetical protein JNM67_06390, partial [Bacteroidetes bacterium]|nr:hypothetical protein [Bacteroidota bacterium]